MRESKRLWILTHKKQIAENNKKWRLHNKDKVNAANRRWKAKNPDYLNTWRKHNHEKSQIINKRHKAKRKRYGFEIKYLNPFAPSEDIDWHHINDIQVVALPKDIHRLYQGHNKHYHRMCLKYIVNQIYKEE